MKQEQDDFLNNWEFEIKKNGKLSQTLLQAFNKLDNSFKNVWVQLVYFCQSAEELKPLSKSKNTYIPSLSDREKVFSILMYLFYLDTNNPRWSSWLLENALRKFLDIPGVKPIDIIKGIYTFSNRYNLLSNDVCKSFVLEISKILVMNYRDRLSELVLGDEFVKKNDGALSTYIVEVFGS